MAGISSLGVGSGLDLGALVAGLVRAERGPSENRLDLKQQKLTTNLSAFGLLRSSLSGFQTSLSGLQSAAAFNAKNVSLSNASIFTTTVASFADTGSFSVEVSALAKSHSLASNAATAFATVDDTIGSGTLSIQFGTTTTGPYSFSPDSAKPAQVIEVSALNNNTTLSGLRDYINDNDYDVQASIVNDGSGYRLVLTSKNTGAANSMEITVTNDADSDDNDNAGLSQLAFNASAQGSLLQTVGAQDAALSINGLNITRDTNAISGAINGVTLNLLKAEVGTSVGVEVSENRSEVTASINGFVSAYNDLIGNIKKLTSYDAETGSGSVLIGDFTVRSISSKIRNLVFDRVSGLDGNIKSLVDIGITTNSNGTLDVNASKLQDVLLINSAEVEALFTLYGSATDPGVRFLGSTTDTQTGDYAINVASLLTQGILAGNGPVNDLRVRNNSNEMMLIVDGIATANVTFSNATYADGDALASEFQSKINADANLVTNAVTVSVSYDATNNRFVITSDSEGSGSSVEITAVESQTFNDFGLSVGTGTAGTDPVASIDGVSADFDGKILTGLTGDSKGLSVELISAGIGNRGSVSLTRGLADKLDQLLNSFLETDGFIASREEGFNEGLEDIVDERIKLDDRIAILEARLIQQFSALDILIAQFNQTSSFLTQQLANLPKPNSINRNN